MTASSPLPAGLATTAKEAWRALESRGLEKDGRDSDLTEFLHQALLRNGLNAGATLDDAIDAASLEQFIRAFFQSAVPYVDMLKDILKWFEQAEAKRGPRGWQLGWDGGDITELQHFREWITQLEQRQVTIDRPVLPFANCGPLIDMLSKAPAAARARLLIDKQNYRALPASVRQFAYTYQIGYEDWATLPVPPTGSASMADLWNIIRYALMQFDSAEIDGQKQASERARALHYGRTDEDGLAFDSLCMLETDSWLLQLVACYGVIVDSPNDQEVIGPDLEAFFATMPRETFFFNDSVETFAAFLDLPLWERRHEFFAAWIASKIVDACAEHQQQLVHDKGVIALPFKRTEVSRILSARPERILFAERRSPLDNSKDDGRKNVQPDFSIWHTETAGEVCDLVVEVKHYLRPAKAKWVEVLEDYAAAHPLATVALINYGHPGNALAAVPESTRTRCRLIGNLRPGQQTALDELRALVRSAVGPAFRRRAEPGERVAGGTPLALVLDRSYSMRPDRPVLVNILHELAHAYGASHVVAATADGDSIWAADPEGFGAAAASPANAQTSFTWIITKLLADYPEIIFITDSDGMASLDRNALFVEHIEQLPQGMEVLHIASK